MDEALREQRDDEQRGSAAAQRCPTLRRAREQAPSGPTCSAKTAASRQRIGKIGSSQRPK